MTLHNRRCLRASGSTLHLPPFNMSIPVITPIEEGADPVAVPFSGTMVFTHKQRVGWEINVSFQLFETSAAAALALQDSLDEMFFESDGRARTFDFADWYDTTGTYKRIYRNCKIKARSWESGWMEQHRTLTFTAISMSGTRYATFSDGTTPGVSPYETYLVNPEGGDPPVPIVQKLIYTGVFAGIAQVTDSVQGQKVFSLRVTSANCKIKGLKVTGCSVAGNGTTTIKVSSGDYNDGADTITATVASGACTGSLVTGDIGPLAANSLIYVFITGANGHEDLEFQVDVESV